MNIILYQHYLAEIGGIETWIYYLLSELKNYYNVIFLYDKADEKQLQRLMNNGIKVMKRTTGKIYECDLLIKASSDGNLNGIVADYYIQMIHANYSELKYFNYNETFEMDKYIAVSEVSKRSFEEKYLTKKAVVIQNYVVKEKVNYSPKNEYLTLVSACRLTSEKGYDRILTLANELNKRKINYKWYIYTNDGRQLNIPNVIKCKPTLNIQEKLANADYVVQLSDTESYCYTIHEALAHTVPVIVTNWNGVNKTVIDKVNGYILDKSMQDCRIEEIINKIPANFKYSESTSIKDWLNCLEEIRIEIEKRRVNKMKARVLINFKDIKVGIIREKGQEFELSKERFMEINNCDYCKTTGQKLIEAIEEEQEITEEEVQAAAGAIVEYADQEDKTVEEVVQEIIEESNDTEDEEPSQEEIEETDKEEKAVKDTDKKKNKK